MSQERTSDRQIGESLLIRVVQDQIERCEGENVSVPPFPDVLPLNNEENQKLLAELAKSVKIIGDQLVREKELNDTIDGLARLGDRNIFPKLVDGVFNDGQINWGRIIVLFYAVGKLAVKMLLAHLPSVFSEILDSCLNFFRTKLLIWIRSVGGWISSISALTQFSIEHIHASSFCTIPSIELVLVFACGLLMGGVIAWKLNKSS